MTGRSFDPELIGTTRQNNSHGVATLNERRVAKALFWADILMAGIILSLAIGEATFAFGDAPDTSPAGEGRPIAMAWAAVLPVWAVIVLLAARAQRRSGTPQWVWQVASLGPPILLSLQLLLLFRK
jgi:hypothetical protein